MTYNKFLGIAITIMCFVCMILTIFVTISGTRSGLSICNLTSHSDFDYTICRINQTF